MKLLYLFIFLSLNILQNSSIVMGDRKLIESTCKSTPSYNLCMSTLLSNPKSTNGDISDLGLIMVGTTNNKVNKAIQHIKFLYTAHPELRHSLNECAQIYVAVVKGVVPSAVQALDGGQPKFAEDGMADTAVETQACERCFSGRGLKSPLTQMNKDIENVANVARAIIRMLL
ncbi:cell wall / vacuolar inhibitor of fructosidase 1-like [Rutidosis leptorrhynchoides]|uniref:cell wall / vacuolar inhibitor of fructosidase 1-like n=1 Tax=Rutidosis leptorrhynchoides TaxID=125765 RepID=UPI003A99F2C0